MLGLGNSVLHNSVAESVFTPASISNLTLWLAVNSNITADEDSSGSSLSPEHSSNAGTMVQADRVNFWGGSGGTSINGLQTTSSRKPRWETSSGNLGGVRSAASNKFFNLSSDITINANTDFTVVVRFLQDKTGEVGLMGDTASEFIRINGVDNIRVKTDGSSGTSNDLAFSSNLQTEITTLMVVRSDGATGNINAFLRSNVSGYFDGTATGTASTNTIQDNEEIVISNVMATADDTGMFDGNFFDVIIYNGTAVTSAQREQLFDYIEGQSHPQ
tara:strand:- start:56 stop:877 length:822 start_codon:yes stop_codon:yes gene_type:complete